MKLAHSKLQSIHTYRSIIRWRNAGSTRHTQVNATRGPTLYFAARRGSQTSTSRRENRGTGNPNRRQACSPDRATPTGLLAGGRADLATVSAWTQLGTSLFITGNIHVIKSNRYSCKHAHCRLYNSGRVSLCSLLCRKYINERCCHRALGIGN